MSKHAKTPTGSEWVSCKDRLPEEHERVIAKYEGVYEWREVTVWYDMGGNVHFGLPAEPDGKGSQPATHWKPTLRVKPHVHP